MQVVEAPKVEKALYGLFSVPGIVENAPDERFSDWVEFEKIGCKATVVNQDICDSTKISTISTAVTGDCTQQQYGFAVVVSDTSTTFGLRELREQRALDQLELCIEKAIENEVWTGNLAQEAGHTDNQWLASSGAVDKTPSPGTPIRIRHGLALLEKALADMGCGGRGIIHATRDVASVIPTRLVDGHLETLLGNWVVASSGGTGESPAGVAATDTSSWMYATSAMKVILGDAFVLGEDLGERTDRSVNTIKTYAQRAASYMWDGCDVFAVNVNISLDLA